MIHCDVCGGKIKPPKRAWTSTENGINFYKAAGPGPAYAKELQRWAKKGIPFVHERCEANAPPGAVVALPLEPRLQAWRQAAH